MKRYVRWAIAVAGFPGLASAGTHAGRDARFFDRRVEPILRAHCLGCHNDTLKDGGLSFASRNGLLLGGARGPAIVPGYPDASVLMQAVRQDGTLTMPPGGKLSAKDIDTLAKWIKRGAPWGTKRRAGGAAELR
ncbi:MAG TPA: c-type cytochrome domain-containing protein [Bryobacteraceae bacterium]|nr:c-type cytochrome domain-containing protein [Bryobacteraceae bacterium]